MKRMAPLFIFAAMAIVAGFIIDRAQNNAANTTPNTAEAMPVFSILSAPQHRFLENEIYNFCKKHKRNCKIDYKDFVDLGIVLDREIIGYDAVWPVHSGVLALNERNTKLEIPVSIMKMPVVFGIRKSTARALELLENAPDTRKIVELVRNKKLSFIMGSGSQTGAGLLQLAAVFSAFSGHDGALTTHDLSNPDAQQAAADFISGARRLSGNASWLQKLYLQGARNVLYPAMSNYEHILLQTNAELARQNLEPLHLFYPHDGLSIADSAISYVKNNLTINTTRVEQKRFFAMFTDYLLSQRIQQTILDNGRRPVDSAANYKLDTELFQPENGTLVSEPLVKVEIPFGPTLAQIAKLYQTKLRTPSLTAMCLDFSTSMKGQGIKSLKEALGRLYSPQTSHEYAIQATQDDILITIPFASNTFEMFEARGIDEMARLATSVALLEPDSGTNIYKCATQAFKTLVRHPALGTHQPAIILLTDGRSSDNIAEFASTYNKLGLDIPVHSIMFGKADRRQLDELATMTRARVFNSQGDLFAAFRLVRGYN